MGREGRSVIASFTAQQGEECTDPEKSLLTLKTLWEIPCCPPSAHNQLCYDAEPSQHTLLTMLWAVFVPPFQREKEIK